MSESPLENRHPGDVYYTEKLLKMAKLSPCKILDMGCGEGKTVRFLRSLGYDAVGVDITAKDDMIKADYTDLPFENESFDAVISECSFFISAKENLALSEAARVLKKGGMLLNSDVCFTDITKKAEELYSLGFKLTDSFDATKEWQRYYIGCVFKGTAPDIGCIKKEDKKKCRYYLSVAVKL